MTVLIESTQLILARGVAEADDILNNFLGTMIGYGIYVLFREITAAAKRKRFSVLKMAAAQIPFAAIVLVFVGIFIMYDRQELGNLEIGLSSRIDMSDVQVTTTENYSSQPGTAAVYKIPVYTEEETRKTADNFFASLGQTLDESRTDLYDETAVYYSTEQNSLWIDYAGGTMSYTDYAVVFGDDPEAETYPEPVSGEDEATVRSALSTYGIQVPEGAVFQEQSDESSDLPGYEFSVSQQRDGDRFYDGSVNGQDGYEIVVPALKSASGGK